jgi:hypothetical protein
MATTPENTVFLRREGTGAAQVFGRAGDPMNAFRERQAQVERRKLIQDEYVRAQKQQRDKEMLEAMDVDPEKTFQPFQKQVLDAADAHRKRTAQYFNSGGTKSPTFEAWNKKEWDKVNNIARTGNYIQKAVGDLTEVIKSNPYLKNNRDAIMKRAFDLYLNPDGTAKPFDQVDANAIQNLPYSPEFYDVDKMVGDWVKELDQNTASWVDRRNTAFGLETDKYKTLYKNGMFTEAPVDKNGKSTTRTGLVEDEYGNPVVNITPEIRNALVNESPERMAAIEYQAKQAKMTPQEYIDSKIKEKLKTIGGGYKKGETEFGQKFYPKESTNDVDESTGLKKKDLPKAQMRIKTISALQNAFWNPDRTRRTEPNDAARQALSYIKQNVKFGNGQILDADIVSGSSNPGTSSVLGMKVPNSATDRIIFKVSYPGQKGKVKYESIPLTKDAGPSFNALLNTATTEGKSQVGFDQLMALDQTSGANELGTWINDEYNAEQLAEAEQKQVTGWQNMEDLESMVGREYLGKAILSATPTPGPLGTGYLGNTAGITIKFQDGSTIELDEDDEDYYGKLAQIHKSTAPQAEEDEPEPQPKKNPTTTSKVEIDFKNLNFGN